MEILNHSNTKLRSKYGGWKEVTYFSGESKLEILNFLQA